MKIQVAKIEEAPDAHRVTFKDKLLVRIPRGTEDYEYTAVGERVTRILRLICGAVFIDSPGVHELTLRGGIRTDFDSVKDLQRQMDKYANTRIKLRFDSPVVRSCRRGAPILHTLADVQQRRAQSELIKVTQVIHLDLPAIVQDLAKLKKVVPGGHYRSIFIATNKDIHVELILRNELADRNPWELMEELEPLIKKVIV